MATIGTHVHVAFTSLAFVDHIKCFTLFVIPISIIILCCHCTLSAKRKRKLIEFNLLRAHLTTTWQPLSNQQWPAVTTIQNPAATTCHSECNHPARTWCLIREQNASIRNLAGMHLILEACQSNAIHQKGKWNMPARIIAEPCMLMSGWKCSDFGQILHPTGNPQPIVRPGCMDPSMHLVGGACQSKSKAIPPKGKHHFDWPPGQWTCTV